MNSRTKGDVAMLYLRNWIKNDKRRNQVAQLVRDNNPWAGSITSIAKNLYSTYLYDVDITPDYWNQRLTATQAANRLARRMGYHMTNPSVKKPVNKYKQRPLKSVRKVVGRERWNRGMTKLTNTFDTIQRKLKK